jgi:hypothetical protein
MRGKDCTIFVKDEGSYVEIGKIFNMNGMEETREDIIDDSFLNFGQEFRTKEPGTKEISDLTFEVAHNPLASGNTENHDILHAHFAANTKAFWKVKYSNAGESGKIAQGFVQQLGPENIQPDETVRLPVTIRFTGAGGLTKADDIDSAPDPTIP